MADVDPTAVPRHIAIIMDGNGRWAKARGLDRTAGHSAGEQSIFETIDDCNDLGVEWLTVYAFSTENWNRSSDEVEFLMNFNEMVLTRHRDDVASKNMRLHFIGLANDPRVPERVARKMQESADMTAENTGMNVVFAFDYGGRAEIVDAVRRLAKRAALGELEPDAIDEEAMRSALYLPEMPDPELIIRTSGEQRLSNFLMWQSAYSELVFTPVLWPDFNKEALLDCIAEYQSRQRRFGG